MLNETFSVIFKYCPIVVTQSILSCKQKCTNCPWKWIGTDFSVEAAWQKKWGQSKKIYWPTYHTPLPADNQGWLRGHNVGKWLKKSRFINVSKASYIHWFALLEINVRNSYRNVFSENFNETFWWFSNHCANSTCMPYEDLFSILLSNYFQDWILTKKGKQKKEQQ